MIRAAPQALSLSAILEFLHYILSGCLCSMIAATVVHLLFNAIPARLIRQRINALILSLYETSEGNLRSDLRSTAQQYYHGAKKLNAFRSTREAWEKPRLLFALIEVQQWLSTMNDKHSGIRSSFRKLLEQCLAATHSDNNLCLIESCDALLQNKTLGLQHILRDDKLSSDNWLEPVTR